jgi:hypothetical protein
MDDRLTWALLARDCWVKKPFRLRRYWAVEQRLGIDFGGGVIRSLVTTAGLELFQRQMGFPLRNAIPGIDVFEHVDNLHFLASNASAQVGANPDRLVEVFRTEFHKTRKPSDKELLAIEIYTSSFFDVTARSRFTTLMTAVEALLEYTESPEEVLTLVPEFQSKAKEAVSDTTVRNSLLGRLNDLRRLSIGQAGRDFVARALPDQLFDGKPAASFFMYLYEKRSQLLHDGRLKGDNQDNWPMVNDAEPFVNSLLRYVLKKAHEQ